MRSLRRNSSLRSTALLLLLLPLVSFSCKHPTAPPPPPPVAASSVTPAPPVPAPVVTLRAEPATIARGAATTLTFESRNAASVTIEPGLGNVGITGNRQVSPASSVTYTATAVGPGGTASDTVRVTVNAPAPPPPVTAAPVPSNPNLTVEQLFTQNVQPVYFDYNQSEIRPDQTSRLQGNAAWLKQNPTAKFSIEGHADERGSEEYNLGLGDRRATAVKQYLVSQGIAESRMSTVSFGEEAPECREQTEDCYQRNRKAAFTYTR